MDPKTPHQSEAPIKDVAVNRRSIRLGPSFAGSIASRLDAHPGAGDGERLEEERKIITLARKTLQKREPDPCAVNFLTQAVEMYTKVHGFSRTIYDELFRLNEARTELDEPPATTRRSPAKRASAATSSAAKPELSRFLYNMDDPSAGRGKKKKDPNNLSGGKVFRPLKA